MKKNEFWILITMLSLSSLLLATSCAKEVTIPVLTTNEVTEVTQTTATSGGSISSDGGTIITERGVCWSTNQSPTIDDNKIINRTGEDIFATVITGLISNTTYYVRAYATNSVGTGYGNAILFETAEENGVGYIIDGKMIDITSIGSKDYPVSAHRSLQDNMLALFDSLSEVTNNDTLQIILAVTYEYKLTDTELVTMPVLLVPGYDLNINDKGASFANSITPIINDWLTQHSAYATDGILFFEIKVFSSFNYYNTLIFYLYTYKLES